MVDVVVGCDGPNNVFEGLLLAVGAGVGALNIPVVWVCAEGAVKRLPVGCVVV